MEQSADFPISLERSSQLTRPIAERLWQLYCHDMSDYFPNELGPEGLFDALPDDCWADEACEHVYLYLILLGERPVGFTLVGRAPYATVYGTGDFVLMEFFIARPYRGSGLGRAAAMLAFGLHRGAWELFVVPENKAAIRFWERVLEPLGGHQIIKPPAERPGSVIMGFQS